MDYFHAASSLIYCYCCSYGVISIEIAGLIMEIRSDLKSERNDEKVNELIEKSMIDVMERNGCGYCGGRNIIVYVNGIERDSASGYYYCHDCNQKGDISVKHDIFQTLDNVENEFKKLIKDIR